ncbi:MAG: hypothetical protein LPK46_01485 [Bacteroidota bacterium]|nr:hypothetical protein [Bacteroidota bacterium]MDX5504789.1 hypothetical protein [Bacteroidota bacterium]
MWRNFWHSISSIVLAFSFMTTLAQVEGSTRLSLVKHYEEKGLTGVAFDHLYNIYHIKGAAIEKMDSSGTVIGHYSLPNSDTITLVDVFNPMAPIVFYKSYNTLVQLDNQLNPRREPLVVNDLDLLDVAAVANYDSDRAWVVDRVTSKMYLINFQEQRVETESLFLGSLLSLKELPIGLVANFDRVYLGLKGEAIYQFTALAAFERKMPAMGFLSFQARNGELILRYPDHLTLRKMETGIETTIPMPMEDVDQAILQGNRLVIRKRQKVFIFEIR